MRPCTYVIRESYKAAEKLSPAMQGEVSWVVNQCWTAGVVPEGDGTGAS